MEKERIGWREYFLMWEFFRGLWSTDISSDGFEVENKRLRMWKQWSLEIRFKYKKKRNKFEFKVIEIIKWEGIRSKEENGEAEPEDISRFVLNLHKLTILVIIYLSFQWK